MRIADMNWMQVEALLAGEDRCVLPIGSTEQHGYLSLCVDATLAERVAADAAEPLGVPVFPPVMYGLAPYFMAYPGTVTLRVETLLAVIGDVLDCLEAHGFRRIVIVNGHGGNAPVGQFALDWVHRHPDMRVKFHSWFQAPRTWEKVQAIDPLASHASWMENFPWTRLAGVALPDGEKPAIDAARLRVMPPAAVRAYIGDGVFAGAYEKPDEIMHALWAVAVEETRSVIEEPWS